MTGGGGAGGGGVTVHNDLTGRSDPDTHPISSITGLSAALAAAGNVDSVNGQTGTVSLDLDDLTDVDTTTDPPDADDVLAWDGVTWTPATLTALGAPAAHAASHGSAGSDPVTLAQSQVTNLSSDLAGKAAASHSHATSDVTGLDEQVRDVVGTALVAGSNVTITVDDPGDSITIAASGGGASGYSGRFLLMGG
jgi:hypothetical protein